MKFLQGAKADPVVISYITCLGAGLFLGYFNFPVSAIAYQASAWEVVFVSLLYIHARPRGEDVSQFLKASNGFLYLWLVAAALILLPYLVPSAHFEGSKYQLMIKGILLLSYPLFIIYFSKSHANAARSVLNAIVFFMMLYAAIFFIAFSTGLHEAPFEGNTNFTFPGFSQVRQMPLFVAPVAALGLVLLSEPQRKDRTGSWWILVIGMVLIWCLILWSGGRGGLLAASLGVTVAAIFAGRFRLRLLETFLLVVPAALVLAHMIPPGSNDLNVRRIWSSADHLANPEELSNGRFILWRFAVEKIQDHPILGHGLNAFPSSKGVFSWIPFHAHNGFLELAYSIGLIGAISVACWVVWTYAQVGYYVRKSHDTVLLASFAGLTACLALEMVDCVWFHYRPLLLMITLFAVARFHVELAKKP